MIRAWLLVCLLGVSASAIALDPMPFKDRSEELRFQEITRELRCLVCQNQNIADSNADLARDLRQEVFEMMRAGKSDDEIKTFMTERYGDFVLYRPPMKPTTWLLWFGPFLALIAGAFFLIRHIRARQRVGTEPAANAEHGSSASDDPNEMIP